MEPKSSEPKTRPGRAAGEKYDLIVIGAGIVGLATAWALSRRYPHKKIAVLEKEHAVASHQTGHNSGVVHSGTYYAPGSLKATLTRRGVQLLRDFCTEHGVKYQECGKVIVATNDDEVARLRRLYERGTANSVPGIRLIDAAELTELEPNANGVEAIHSPSTAIVDFVGVCKALVTVLEQRGVDVHTGRQVLEIERRSGRVHVRGEAFQHSADFLVNCAGLHSDRVAGLGGTEPTVRIIPFRGEYYMLRPESRHLVRGLIYPVPNPDMPFLGVHFTKMVNGEVEAGPNAVLALAREAYRGTTMNLNDLVQIAGYGGFWRLARKYWNVGAFEVYRSLSKSQFVRSLRRLVPAVRAEDLVKGSVGVRAQAVDSEGNLVDDFVVQAEHLILNVLNAPSPAATASLAIGEHIADLVNIG